MMPKISIFLKGYVQIRISGSAPEKLINLCVAEGLFLWRLSRAGDDIFAWILLRDFYRIRPLVRKTRSHITVISRQGWPFVLKKIMRRKMMVSGLLLFLFTIQILASYVWFIEVTGAETVSPQQILAVAEERGLKRGTAKRSVSSKDIETTILLMMPQISWVSVHYTGTRAIIEIVEKTVPKPEERNPSQIVADKDGIITDIIVLSGQGAVSTGSTVKKGDVLIKGVMPEPAKPLADGKAPNITAPLQLVKARGIVKARCWYEGYGEAMLVQELFHRTGERETEIYLIVGDHTVPVKIGRSAFAAYESEVIHKTLPGWRNQPFTVESHIIIRYETISTQKHLSLEEARTEAAAAALAAVQHRIPPEALVLARTIETLKLNENNMVRVKVSAETIEEIGKSVNISQQSQ